MAILHHVYGATGSPVRLVPQRAAHIRACYGISLLRVHRATVTPIEDFQFNMLPGTESMIPNIAIRPHPLLGCLLEKKTPRDGQR